MGYERIDGAMQQSHRGTMRAVVLFGYLVEDLSYPTDEAQKAGTLLQLIHDDICFLQIAPWGDAAAATAVIGVHPFDILTNEKLKTLNAAKKYLDDKLKDWGFTVDKFDGKRIEPMMYEGVFED